MKKLNTTKKLLLILLCFPMMFVSCNFTDSKKDIAEVKDTDSVIYSDAKEYFSDIIELQMEIAYKITGFTETESLIEMRTEIIKLENLTQRQLEKLERIEFLYDDMGFKSAVNDEFIFYQLMMQEYFPKMFSHLEIIESSNSQTEVENSYYEILEINEKIQKEQAFWDQRLIDSQKNFTKKYNIVIAENPLQDRLDEFNEGNIYHENLKK
tara:strand:+ start:920 stop:1549 length:630 start_codon:yes stop_codon:yes gene_type:complete